MRCLLKVLQNIIYALDEDELFDEIEPQTSTIATLPGADYVSSRNDVAVQVSLTSDVSSEFIISSRQLLVHF